MSSRRQRLRLRLRSRLRLLTHTRTQVCKLRACRTNTHTHTDRLTVFVCVHLLSILRFVALKFLFRFLFEVYKVLTECLRSPFLSHTHTHKHTPTRSHDSLFVQLTLFCSLARSLSLSLSQLLLLPPTEADVATTRRCSSNYAGTHAYTNVCLYVCVCSYMGQLEVLGEKTGSATCCFANGRK